MSIQSYLEAAPKAELHVHLEGSVEPATLLRLAEKNGVALPASTVEGLREWFAFRDFSHFIEVYWTITKCLRTADDYEFIAYELGASMARQNIRYAEATFSPSSHYALGVSPDVFLAGLEEGRSRAKADFGVQINWIFDIVRQNKDESYIDFTTGVAIEYKENGVVALGLGGAEADHAAERFEPWFDRARSAGLHSCPHAGELAGPESVWGALRVLGAERIGHGVRSIEDPELVEYLAERHVPLEICPSSNLRLGIYARPEDHPLRRLYEAGVPVTINSDDPPIFNTSLNDEVLLLDSLFGLAVEDIDEILLNGARYAFLPPGEKEALEAGFRAQLASLKVTHLQ